MTPDEAIKTAKIMQQSLNQGKSVEPVTQTVKMSDGSYVLKNNQIR